MSPLLGDVAIHWKEICSAVSVPAKAKQSVVEANRTYVENSSPEVAANTIICLIHQTNYLLDQQLRQLEKAFLEEGGFTERLYQFRKRRQ
jgi:four helix bundle suffix protein